MAWEKKKQKEDTPHQRYTKTTFLIQILMSVMAVFFIAPILIIINYSFKTKKELYLTSPLSLPSSFQLDNYKKAFDKLNLRSEEHTSELQSPS